MDETEHWVTIPAATDLEDGHRRFWECVVRSVASLEASQWDVLLARLGDDGYVLVYPARSSSFDAIAGCRVRGRSQTFGVANGDSVRGGSALRRLAAGSAAHGAGSLA